MAYLAQKDSVESTKKANSNRKNYRDLLKSGTTRNDRDLLKNLDNSHTFSLKYKSNASASKLNKTSITTGDKAKLSQKSDNNDGCISPDVLRNRAKKVAEAFSGI